MVEGVVGTSRFLIILSLFYKRGAVCGREEGKKERGKSS